MPLPGAESGPPTAPRTAPPSSHFRQALVTWGRAWTPSPLLWHLRSALLSLMLVLSALLLHVMLGPVLSFQRPLVYLLVAVTASSFLWGSWGGLYASVYSLVLLIVLGGDPPLSPASLTLFALLCAAPTALVSHLHRLNSRLLKTVEALQQANSELNEAQAQLSEAAYSDPLTRLGNRRAFDEDLVSACQAVRGAADRGAPFTVALIDLDGLKQVNDLEGHLRGDALLRTFAHSLQSALPAEARLYRFGGDEFALIWPQRSGDPLQPDDRVEAAVEQAVSFTRDLGFARAAASVGTAAVPHEAQEERMAVELSDRRLYASKHARTGGRRWNDASPDEGGQQEMDQERGEGAGQREAEQPERAARERATKEKLRSRAG